MKVELIKIEKPWFHTNYWSAILTFRCAEYRESSPAIKTGIREEMDRIATANYTQIRDLIAGNHPEWLNGHERISYALEGLDENPRPDANDNHLVEQNLVNLKHAAAGISIEWRAHYDAQMR